jgi:Kelch motif/Galactose oxidase, central domain
MSDMNTTTQHLRRHTQLIGIAILIAVAAILATNAGTQSSNTFLSAGSLPSVQRNAVSLLLPSNMLLIVGGIDSSSRLTSIVLYDPGSGDFSIVARMDAPYDSATLLNGGNVLLTGGGNFVPRAAGGGVLTTAQLYDSATGTLTNTGPTLQGVTSAVAVRLSDGSVLLTGGKLSNRGGLPTAAAEVYDPASGTFRFVGAMTVARYNHTATLLQNGQVLVAGGSSSSLTGAPLASAELYDPTSRRFTRVNDMTSAHANHTATLVADGRVLIAGGSSRPSSTKGSVTSVAEIYDPSTESFSVTGSMQFQREFHRAVRLDNGEVLVAGGDDSRHVLASTEVYDPTSGVFGAGPTMKAPRSNFTIALLNNGDVLVAGGLTGPNEGAITALAELYRP